MIERDPSPSLMTATTRLRVAAIVLFLGIALGAFGAHALADRFPASPTPLGQRGTTRFAVTDNVERFQQVGALFLGEVPSPVSWVDLPAAHAPFEPPGGEP